MKPFSYSRAADVDRAIAAGHGPDTEFLAGGTTLIDLMRLEVMTPAAIVDVGVLPLAAIEATPGGGVRIGAMAKNAAVAHDPTIAARYPVLAQALLAGASPQIRNMASIGGNLLQRTRCPYFRDRPSPCNKREPGTGCSALTGFTRSHAVLGTSARCIATHPSDMAVALVALDAIVHVKGPAGERTLPIGELHTLPGDHPEIETTLAPGELIVAVELPALPFAATSTYVKVRDRAAFAFALASAAVALDVDRAGGTIRAARIALGGVATKPWRCVDAEHALVGQRAAPAVYRVAADAALAGADPHPGNQFKIELARRTLIRALETVGGGAA